MKCDNGTIYFTEPQNIFPTVNSVVFVDSEGIRCTISLETLLRLVDVHKHDMIRRNVDYEELVNRTIEQYMNRLTNKVSLGDINGVD